MAGMKQDQQRYAMQRVKEIKEALDRQIRDKCTSKTKPKSESAHKRCIYDGEYRLRPMSRWNLKTPIGECFELADDKFDELDSQKYRARYEELRKQAAVVTDEIMLGDAENARKLLEEFESKVSVK